eukprot:TRINITY_DN2890_c0_g1_i1.p3 TRINITY_DN2890_c0_g1~~TRINITY_DN2890_c0_g1_i1.p3  ORF type:complete len:233 (+),score=40.31 TRINITY_DN2890_c0_g1_i1:81-779(+)
MGQTCKGCNCVKEDKELPQESAPPPPNAIRENPFQDQVLSTEEDMGYLKKLKEKHEQFAEISDHSIPPQHGEEGKKVEAENVNKVEVQAADVCEENCEFATNVKMGYKEVYSGMVQKRWAGRTSIGEIINKKRNGKGVCKWPNGDEYDGDWKNDMFHGKGVFRSNDGRVYDGNWRDGKLEGYAKVIDPTTGCTIEGEFHNDLAHGHGKEVWIDGKTYEGEFKEGKRFGHGTD